MPPLDNHENCDTKIYIEQRRFNSTRIKRNGFKVGVTSNGILKIVKTSLNL